MPDYMIKPYDVLFFRGNKSFHFGAWRTEGVFPPFPSTFQGFIRNKLLLDSNLIDAGGKLKDTIDAKKQVEQIGDDKNIGVDITGPYLMSADTGRYISGRLQTFSERLPVVICVIPPFR